MNDQQNDTSSNFYGLGILFVCFAVSMSMAGQPIGYLMLAICVLAWVAKFFVKNEGEK